MRHSRGSTPTATPPLVLLHGPMDSPRVFDRLRRPQGEHRQELAEWLGRQIAAAFGPCRPVECCRFYPSQDLRVLPGWSAVLPLAQERLRA